MKGSNDPATYMSDSCSHVAMRKSSQGLLPARSEMRGEESVLGLVQSRDTGVDDGATELMPESEYSFYRDMDDVNGRTIAIHLI